ncbi:hypothetical protein [Actinokineospora sp. HUAS TT18]|uniref:hypothetical protein n=1 Tax=Actinokineospora sp. HUAS TT18 TaxID=3447451 RepID=UPI003F523CBC
MTDAREALLTRAGLEVLGAADLAGTVTPAEAWRRVASGAAAVEIPEDDPLARVDTEWRALADETGLLDADGSFLISPAGVGSAKLGWVVVRLTPTTRLAATLVAHPGEPEFVTAARDGHVVLGVTTEEYGVWLVRA